MLTDGRYDVLQVLVVVPSEILANGVPEDLPNYQQKPKDVWAVHMQCLHREVP